jgi:hypothetical protein
MVYNHQCFEGTCCLYPQTAMKMEDGYGTEVQAFQWNMLLPSSLYSEDGGSMFLCNAGNLLPNYMAS